jgi:hypothetical protein
VPSIVKLSLSSQQKCFQSSPLTPDTNAMGRALKLPTVLWHQLLNLDKNLSQDLLCALQTLVKIYVTWVHGWRLSSLIPTLGFPFTATSAVLLQNFPGQVTTVGTTDMPLREAPKFLTFYQTMPFPLRAPLSSAY